MGHLNAYQEKQKKMSSLFWYHIYKDLNRNCRILLIIQFPQILSTLRGHSYASRDLLVCFNFLKINSFWKNWPFLPSLHVSWLLLLPISLHVTHAYLHLTPCCLLTDVVPCNNNPCQNDGACVNLIDGYVCVCRDGYLGTHCEIGKNLHRSW